jgi:hypothetical protein
MKIFWSEPIDGMGIEDFDEEGIACLMGET